MKNNLRKIISGTLFALGVITIFISQRPFWFKLDLVSLIVVRVMTLVALLAFVIDGEELLSQMRRVRRRKYEKL